MDRTCVMLLLLIHFRRDVSREGKSVSLPSGFLAEFGIDKSAKQRALKRLEQAKLIDVERRAGHTAVIKLRAKKQRVRK